MSDIRFARFVAPARRRPQIWRLLLGALLALAVYLGWVVLLFGAIWLLGGAEAARHWTLAVTEPDTAPGVLLLLATFAGMAAGPIVAARLLHGRGPGSLFGPARRVARDFLTAAGVVVGLGLLSLAAWTLLYDARPNLELRTWLLLLPLAIPGILLQTLAEELVFRGYLLQQLAARFRARALWMGLPAAIFGLAHYDPQSGPLLAWLIVGSAFLFGLAGADLTARTGALGAAWGFHFANNALAILLLATEGTITGLALDTTPYAVAEAGTLGRLVIVDAGVMVLAWGLLRWRFRG